jgi:hypothetical protein
LDWRVACARIISDLHRIVKEPLCLISRRLENANQAFMMNHSVVEIQTREFPVEKPLTPGLPMHNLDCNPAVKRIKRQPHAAVGTLTHLPY